jgi:drug/metabolite transporter (DMT)-like permease
VQLATAAALHGVVAVAGGEAAAARWDAAVVGAIVSTALLASAGAFWIQTAAQRVVAPTRTALIFTLEPVFAGVSGALLLGERLSARAWAGAALILTGMVVAEIGGRARQRPAPPAEPVSAAAALTRDELRHR